MAESKCVSVIRIYIFSVSFPNAVLFFLLSIAVFVGFIQHTAQIWKKKKIGYLRRNKGGRLVSFDWLMGAYTFESKASRCRKYSIGSGWLFYNSSALLYLCWFPSLFCYGIMSNESEWVRYIDSVGWLDCWVDERKEVLASEKKI